MKRAKFACVSSLGFGCSLRFFVYLIRRGWCHSPFYLPYREGAVSVFCFTFSGGGGQFGCFSSFQRRCHFPVVYVSHSQRGRKFPGFFPSLQVGLKLRRFFSLQNGHNKTVSPSFLQFYFSPPFPFFFSLFPCFPFRRPPQ